MERALRVAECDLIGCLTKGPDSAQHHTAAQLRVSSQLPQETPRRLSTTEFAIAIQPRMAETTYSLSLTQTRTPR